jgi:hypothetical protein
MGRWLGVTHHNVGMLHVQHLALGRLREGGLTLGHHHEHEKENEAWGLNL